MRFAVYGKSGRGYLAEYAQSDYGTERVLRLIDATGRYGLGQCDPFWPGGIPVEPKAQERALVNAAVRLVADVEGETR